MKTSETICVDIGNSGMRCVRVDARCHCAVDPKVTPWHGEVLRVDWAAATPTRPGSEVGTVESSPPDHDPRPAVEQMIAESLHNWLAAPITTDESSNHSNQPGERVARRWLVSSVQRAMESCLRSVVYAQSNAAVDYRLVTYRDLDLQVDVQVPERVGIDRLLAASAAAGCNPARPLIVVQAGSAITIDVVEKDRVFAGGAILPGVPMMLRLLSKAADMLPEVTASELLDLPQLPGKNTCEAMNVGVSSAVVGGAQHLVQRYRELYGAQTPVIISGGDGPRLSPHIPPPMSVIDQLVLRGLAQLAHQLDQ